MIEHEDRVPRNVIDACVCHGEQMLKVLAPMIPTAQLNDELEEVSTGHWWLRLHAVMTDAHQRDETALEQTLDWATQIAADEEEDWEYRLLIAHHLLDFPRERHLELLTDLAKRQEYIGRHFDEGDIKKACARQADRPNWEHFSDPWQFYTDRQIKQRQQRWQEADRVEYDMDLKTIDVMARELGYHDQRTCQRDTPKTGRNDPCPGEGRRRKSRLTSYRRRPVSRIIDKILDVCIIRSELLGYPKIFPNLAK